MIRQSLFTAMALLFLLLAETAAAAGQGPLTSGRVDATGQQQILVLDGFQYGLPVPDAVNRGIIAALTEGGFSISNICVQHLDFDRFPGADHRADVVRLLRHKIIGRHPGAVIIMGALAVDFVAKECKELFSDETFITVTTPDITPLTGGRHKIIDIPWKEDTAGTLRAALNLFPATRHVEVVTGANDRILPFLDETRKTFAAWKDQLSFEYTNEMTYEKMMRRIASLPKNSIIIYSPYFVDVSGRSFVPAEVVGKISQAAAVPVFSSLEVYLGRGIMGGSLLETESIGKQAGRVAIDYLRGHLSLSDPVTTFYTPSRMMFDWRELSRWHADSGRLPEDSIIIHRPVTLWGQYRGVVIATGWVILILFFSIAAMMVQNRRLKQMRILASDSEARYRALVEHAPEAIIIYDLDLKGIMDVNTKAERLLDCRRDTLLQGGSQVQALGVTEILGDFNDAVLSGEEKLSERSFHKPGGGDVICEVRIVRLPYQFKRMLRISFIDISDRKRAERALYESEEKFRNFADQSLVGIFLIQDGIFKYVNPKFSEIFGYTVAQCLSRMTFDQLVYHEDLNLVRENVGKRISENVKTVHYEFRGIRQNGEMVYLESFGSSMSYYGKPAATGTILDITERKKTEDERKKLEFRLIQAQKMEAIGSLAGGIAHDLNNILFPICGLSELLLDAKPSSNSEYGSIEQIHKSAKRGSELVKQILAFSRQSNPQKLPIRIQPVLIEVLKLARATIPANIEIYSHIDTECGMVSADPTQLHQIMMNLITNAYHAVEGKGGMIDIALKETELDKDDAPAPAVTPGRYACLTVSDTGAGIDPALIHKIFDPYFTTKEMGKGTGLGLSVVHGIVRDHGGDIRVYSKAGKGSAFHVYLPLLMDAKGNAPAPETGKSHAAGSERILLVDDEAPIAKMVQAMLERQGYRVTARTSSLDALEVFKSDPSGFDLIISDRGMPNMTGEQLARELIQLRPGMPIIIFTGFSDETDEQNARAIGIKGFLKKPVSTRELFDMVRKVLDNASGNPLSG